MNSNPIVLRLRDLDDEETEAALRSKAQALTDNPTAATGLTTTAVMLVAAADLIKEQVAAKGVADAAAAAATVDKNQATDAGKELITDYADEVWKATGKNVAKVKLLDFDVSDGSSPPPPPSNGQMSGLVAQAGPNAGSLVVKADPMPRKLAIDVQVNLTPNAAPTWTNQQPQSATPFTITGLPPGTLVQVRIRAIFANGVVGPWSDIAETRVP